jgi:hypothetical protein
MIAEALVAAACADRGDGPPEMPAGNNCVTVLVTGAAAAA